MRKSPVRNLFVIGASCAAMVALMCGHFMPVQLNSDIGNIMPVLHDVWLYIHTNMIITSYAVIGCAYVTAAIYLVGRMVSRRELKVWMLMVVPSVVLGLVKAVVPESLKGTINPAWYPFLLIPIAACVVLAIKLFMTEAARAQLAKNWTTTFGVKTFADAAMSVPAAIKRKGREQVIEANRDSDARGLERVLDGATMIFLHLSFIMLWTGTVMGAIWADHSWGRPWGWDPKEVFALNTWIIFLILVHVRIQVKEKALWTAVLAVVGTAVMLFNWIAVNFFIVGLHSYA
jgi:ABC-type transport system involved in cytochrome c biogenesis permease subunit